MIACPECGAKHYPGTLFCDLCGAAVHPAARAHIARAAPRPIRSAPASQAPRPETGPVQATPPTAGDPPGLHVHIPSCRRDMALRAPVIHVGRVDPDTGYNPELDLTACGGLEGGVSRRHATIQWSGGGFVLIDQHSSNGTWLEGARLVAGYAYQLPPRATVRFGDLVVQLSLAE